MDLQTLDLQSFAKRILELLGANAISETEIRLEKLADGSVRIAKEAGGST